MDSLIIKLLKLLEFFLLNKQWVHENKDKLKVPESFENLNFQERKYKKFLASFILQII